MFIRIHISKSFLTLLAAIAVVMSCQEKGPLYEAEKELFKARKMRHELSSTTVQGEFLTRTLDTYRGIVEEYKDQMNRQAELDTIIVTAQIEMAQLEFQTGMLEKAYRDFRDAAELSSGIPAARANAIYSAAVIARQMNNPESSLEHYSQFYQRFLSPKARPFPITLNRRYILAPIEAAHLYLEMGKGEKAREWYGIAEELYSEIAGSGEYPGLAEESRLNLITVMLQKEEWGRARRYLGKLKEELSGEERLPALMYIEARIELDGYDNRDRAVRILEEIATEYPRSEEASGALVAAAGIRFREGNYSKARELCTRIISNYGNRNSEVAEATWILAEIEEKSGDWLEASLHYKALYTNHPYTLQGLEAPLRIATHFAESGEKDVASQAYERAREHYRTIISESNSQGARIMAEKYLVRALTEDGKWKEAVGRLLELVDEYPGYSNFRGNYLRAASISEEKLSDSARAAEILNSCVRRYPGTPLASEARKQLNRIRRGE
ncbi:MAG: tetratricopeptide repeat protein [Candidatus Latescibacteria bacterium]|nr:tetratricopeptide repeat protein [bacterium]MBD3424176.1 tetratricopeptide repeat protein [Candidatus Latescibacterota bacterium]